MPYWRLHYHITWSTLDRQPLLTPEREKIFYGVLYHKAKELGLKVHAAGNVEDHVHLVLSIPPRLSLADCIRHIKGASAHAINRTIAGEEKFQWQEGYGALTIGERSLPGVMRYVAHQKEHHQTQKTIIAYEQTEEDE